MTTWTITAVDLDAADCERGTVAFLPCATRGEALARGCEAILDGWVDVRVESTFTTYALVA